MIKNPALTKLETVCRTAVIGLVLASVLTWAPSSQASDLLSAIAVTVPSGEANIPTGSIICTHGQSYIPCSSPASPTMFGVSTEAPLLSLTDDAISQPINVIRSGDVLVRVSTSNGPITKGDLVTSSNNPGVAEKANDNGPVLGIAQADYTESDPSLVGTITVSMHPAVAAGVPSTDYRGGQVESDTSTWLRYGAATLIVITTVISATVALKKASSISLEAIGRNPLAKNSIQLSLITSYTVIAGLVGLGIAAAYLTLTL